MFVTVKHNPTPLQPAPLHFPYDLQADQLVKTIKGLNNCGEAKLCFLCEEPCVFQWKDPPPLSPLSLASVSIKPSSITNPLCFAPDALPRFWVPKDPPLPRILPLPPL